MPSPKLVAAIDQLEPAAYTGEAFRHQAAQYNPLSGAGARSLGGRWNPPESFATLYLAIEGETVVAEFNRMAERSRRAPQDFLPRRLYQYEIRLSGLVDLRTPEAMGLVGLTGDDLRDDDPTACQAVGEAAQYLGREGVVAPSATGTGTVLAVYFDRLEPESVLQPLDYETWEAPPSGGVTRRQAPPGRKEGRRDYARRRSRGRRLGRRARCRSAMLRLTKRSLSEGRPVARIRRIVRWRSVPRTGDTTRNWNHIGTTGLPGPEPQPTKGPPERAFRE